MDTEHDHLQDQHVKRLGLSAKDFEEFLIEEKYLTPMELAVNPAIICKLMQDEEIWGSYEYDRECRAEAQESDDWYYLNGK